MKIRTHKQLYIFFIILALIIAGILGIFLKQQNLPYTFTLDKKILKTGTKSSEIYNDLNFDGTSEKIRFASAFQKANKKTIANDYIEISNGNGTILDQYNLFSFSSPEWIHFEDYNNDNFKEIFAFSQLNDSLFLTVINVKTKEYLLHRQFVLSKPDSAKKNFWDIWVRALGLIDANNNGEKELIFSVIAAYSIYPRTVYSYSIKDKKITHKFETGSLLHPVEFGDINNDGKNEIIIYTNATGNLPDTIGYHDFSNWLFVLDKNLKPIFTPKKIGGYPGSLSIYMITESDKKRIFAISYELKNSKQISIGLLYNSKGELLDTLKNLPDNLYWPLKITQKNQDFIVVPTKNGDLLKLNNKLEIVKTRHSLNKNLYLISEIVFNSQEPKAILAMDSDYKLYLFDKDLNTLGIYNLNERFTGFKNHYSVKFNNSFNSVQLALIGDKNNFLFTIKENKIYVYLPLIILGIAFISFLLFGILHIIYSYISTYIKYFTHSLNKSSNGILVLNNKGKIYYSNNNIIKYLKLESSGIKKESYLNVLRKHTSIISAISTSLKTQKEIKRNLNISTPEFQFEGTLTITPFTSPIGYTYSCLVEVSDFTQHLLKDRGKVWTATLQRIAHEIKTPLSTLVLSLENIKTGLHDKSISINDEINMMQRELERIKQLTNNFMIFTNLDKPNFAELSLPQIILESANNFRSYFAKGMKLNYDNNDLNVYADKRQLLQLFSLIIENGIDACDGKGEISIYSSEIIGHSRSCIKIVISDNGKGMNKATLQRIFEPYFTTKKDGTGLGLSLVKKIVEDNNGKIKIDSEKNKGTIVTIYLVKSKS